MKKKDYNRFKEFICVLFGHDFSKYSSKKEMPENFMLEEKWECTNCGLSIYDESGTIQRARETFKIGG
uniref:Uncharacterized protein n=1 Tax=viral metagenome TaxID=1070528 RepID=A0A6M3J5X5_9ZZZZ